jgi:hypothetical protein
VRAILLALFLANTSMAAEVSATRLDGSTVEGELKGWEDDLVVLETTEGDQRIALKELLSLRWQPVTPATESDMAAASGQVELVDGSVLPISEFRSSASRANVTLAGPASSHTDALTIAKRQIAAVRLQPLDAALVEQWNDIRETKPAADVIVLLNREGQSLDYVEGVLGDVSPEKVEFEIDGDTVRKIDRKKVAGFIYFRRDAEEKSEPRFAILGRSGLKANTVHARLEDNVIQLTTAGGTKLSWPLEDVDVADFSGGKIVYLSDLEPASKISMPLVALPDGTSLASKYVEPRRDQSAYGGSLTLAIGDGLSNPSNSGTQSFNKGVAIRSRTELVYRLPSGYRRLNAIAGIDPVTRASGNVHLEIFGDDRSLLSSDVTGIDPPQTIDLEVAGVKRLKIVVDYGQNLDTGDWLNLCDLRIVK